MSHEFLTDGWARLESAGGLADRQKLMQEIAEKYKEQLAEAGPVRRFFLRWQMRRHVARAYREITPSNKTLWFSTS